MPLSIELGTLFGETVMFVAVNTLMMTGQKKWEKPGFPRGIKPVNQLGNHLSNRNISLGFKLTLVDFLVTCNPKHYNLSTFFSRK